MDPIITQVEDIDELLPRFETRELQHALVDNRLLGIPLGIRHSDASPVSEFEFMQMRSVPARKGIVDPRCELSK
jgi:hypothetical protein